MKKNAVGRILYQKIPAKSRIASLHIPARIICLLLALLMGAPGALAAMYTIRHKTRKPVFTVLVPGMLLLQAVVYGLMTF